jgi:hypothetical protein
VRYLFVQQNPAGRVVGGPEHIARATATRRNNQLRAKGEPLRYVEVADLNLFYPVQAGTCKDCGAGTLNNKTNPAFVHDDQARSFRCLTCGSLHIDVVSL